MAVKEYVFYDKNGNVISMSTSWKTIYNNNSSKNLETIITDLDNSTVKLTGDQTIAGSKTFSSTIQGTARDANKVNQKATLQLNSIQLGSQFDGSSAVTWNIPLAGNGVASGLISNAAQDIYGAKTFKSATVVDNTLTVNGATSLKGNISLGDATSDEITVTGRLVSNVVPKVAKNISLGTNDLRFGNLYGTLAGDENGFDVENNTNGGVVPTGIDGEYAKVNDLVGVSRVPNQLFNVATSPTTTSQGITRSVNTTTGILTWSGLTESATYLAFGTIDLISGNVYLINFDVTDNGTNALTMNAVGFSTNPTFSASHKIDILTANSNGSQQLRYNFSAGQSINSTIRIIVRNLTQYFGGTVPADAETVAGIQQNYPELLVPSNYDTGTVVSTTYSAVKSVGKNIVQDIYQVSGSNPYAVVLFANAELEPSTTYTISFIGANGNSLYTNEHLFNIVSIVCNGTRQSLTVTTKSEISHNNINQYQNGRWMLLKNSGTNTVNPYFSNVQIEKGSSMTDYSLYMIDTLTLSSPVTLSGVRSSSIHDTYRLETGVVTRVIGKRTYNGTEDWVINGPNASSNISYFQNSNTNGWKYNQVIGAESDSHLESFLCNAGIVHGFQWFDVQMKRGLAVSYGFRVSLENANPDIMTVDQFKTWLSSHPITLYYEMSNPTTEQLTPVPNCYLKVQPNGSVSAVQTQDPVIDSKFTTHYYSQVDAISRVPEALYLGGLALSKANQGLSNMVDLTSAQTISGAKTFTSQLTLAGASASGNVSVGGTLTLTGKATLNGNVDLGSDANDLLALKGKVSTNVIPNANKTLTLGSSDLRWKGVYGDLAGHNNFEESVQINSYVVSSVPSMPSGVLNKVGARAVSWNQKLLYGNFPNGQENQWQKSNGSIAFSNNECTYTINTIAPNTYENRIWRSAGAPVAGHKYLLSGEVYAPYSNYYTLNYAGIIVYKNPTPNSWTRLIGTGTPQNTNGSFFSYVDCTTNYAVNDTFKFRNLMLFDLTTMQEVSLTADQFVAKYPSSYYYYATPVIVPINPSGFKVVGRNKIDPSDLTTGKWVDATTGNLQDDSTRSATTEYQSCSPNVSYFFGLYDGSTSAGNDYAISVAWYDINKTFISGKHYGTNHHTVISPNNAYFFRIGSTQPTYNVIVNISDSNDGTFTKYSGQTVLTPQIADGHYVNENCYDYVENVVEDGIVKGKKHDMAEENVISNANVAIDTVRTNTTRTVFVITPSKPVAYSGSADNIPNISMAGFSAVAQNVVWASGMISSRIEDHLIYITTDPNITLATFLGTYGGKKVFYGVAEFISDCEPISNFSAESGTTIDAITPQTELVNRIDVPFTVHLYDQLETLESVPYVSNNANLALSKANNALANMVDLSSAQTISGNKTFSGTLGISGTLSLGGSINGSAIPSATATHDLGNSTYKWRHLNLSGTATVGGDLNASGNVSLGGNVTLGTNNTKTLTLNAKVATDVIPNTNKTLNLGSSDKRWNGVYGELAGHNNLVDSAQTNCYAVASVPSLGSGELSKVGARSVAWNQLSNIADASGASWGNGTYSYSSGTLTINCNAAASTVNAKVCDINVEVIQGHVYFISAVGLTSDFILYSSNGSLSLNGVTGTLNFSGTMHLRCYKAGGFASSVTYTTHLMVFDLTAMNMTSLTANQFRALFPASYYSYDTGHIYDLNPTSMKVVGFNKFNGTWEQGGIDNSTGGTYLSNKDIRTEFVNVNPSTTYFLHIDSTHNALLTNRYLHFYDVSNNWISAVIGQANDSTFTTPSNCAYIRLRVTAQPNEISPSWGGEMCVNISQIDTSKPLHNGVYEPYSEQVVDTPFLSGKHYVNSSCYDYSENVYVDGILKRKDQQIVGSYTFTGNESWSAYGSGYQFVALTDNVAFRTISNTLTPSNCITDVNLPITSRKTIEDGGDGISISNKTIYISDKSNLAGKSIYYKIDVLLNPTYSDPIPNFPVEVGTTITAVTPQTTLVNAIDVPMTVHLYDQVETIESVPYVSNTASLALKKSNQALDNMVDLSSNQTIGGNKSFTGNTTLGDSSSDTLAVNAKVTTDVVPSADKTKNLGSDAARWNNVYGTLAGDEGGFDVSYTNTSTGIVPTDIDFVGDHARVDTLRGVSVAYNQLVAYKNPNSSVWDMTTDADGVVTLTAKSSASGEQSVYVTENFTYTSEHKILIFLDKLEITSSKLLASNFYYNFSSPWLSVTAKTTIASRIRNAGCLFRFMQYTSNGFDAGDVIKFKVRACDLTQMLGSSVADYLYSMEQATAGAGVALFSELVSTYDNSYETGDLASTTYNKVESYSTNILDNTSFIKGRIDAGVIGYAAGTSSMTITETGVDFTVTSAWRGVVSELTRVKPSTTYTLNFTAISSVHAFISEYTSSNSYITTSEVRSPFPSTFTTSATTDLIRLSFQLSVVGSVSITNLTIKAGNDGTYTPHLLDTLTLSNPVALRGIFKVQNNALVVDGDKYDLKTGNIERNNAKVTVNGSESFSWTHESYTSYETDMFYTGVNNIIPGYNTAYGQSQPAHLVTNRFIVVSRSLFIPAGAFVCCVQTGTTTVFMLQVPSSLGLTTSALFKSWLASNPLEIVYELATPTTEHLDPLINNFIKVEKGGSISTIQSQSPQLGSSWDVHYYSQVEAISEVPHALDIASHADDGVYGTNAGPDVTDTTLIKASTVDFDTSARLKRMIGGSKAWNQLVKNGNFENTTGWNAWGGSIAGATGNTLEVNVTSTNSYGVSISCNLGSPTVLGHKCLVSFRVKVSDYTKVKGSKLSRPFQQGVTFSDNNWMTFNAIAEVTYATGFEFQIGSTDGTLKAYFQVVNVFDLTLIYGAGNEPITVEQFKADFPALYYEYNAGDIISRDPTAVASTEINIWDEQWEVGRYDTTTGDKQESTDRIRSANSYSMNANTEYYFLIPYSSTISGFVVILFYDVNGDYLSYTSVPSNGGMFTTPSNCATITFFVSANYGTTYKNDIQICLASLPDSIKKIYHPYCGVTTSIDIHKYFPTGLHSAGTAYDEIDWEHRVAIQRVGIIDLGTLTWNRFEQTSGVYLFNATLPAIAMAGMNGIISSALLTVINGSTTSWDTMANNTIGWGTNGTFIRVRADAYTTVNTFKSAMSSVYLYYELATPIYTPIDEPAPTYPVFQYGQESWVIDSAQLAQLPIEATRTYLSKAENIRNISNIDYIANEAYNGLYSEAPSPRNESAWLTKESNVEADTQIKVTGFKGKSWAWNQLFKYLSSNNYTARGDTTTNPSFSNNSVSFTATTTFAGLLLGSGWRPTIPVHKLLISASVKCSAARQFRFAFNNNGSFIYTTSKTLTANTEIKYEVIHTLSVSAVAYGFESYDSQNGDTYTIGKLQFFDLTLIYGPGNEPTTVDQFHKDFPAAYYDYNAGSITSTDPVGMTTTEVNIWDEEWTNAYIDQNNGNVVSISNYVCTNDFVKVLPLTTYSLVTSYAFSSGNAIGIALYDINKNFIKFGYSTRYDITTDKYTYYIKFFMPNGYGNIYKHDIQICLDSLPTYIKSKYHPYSGHTTNIDIHKYFPTGLHSAGDVYDEIDYERGLAIQRVGVADMSDFIYTRGTAGNYEYFEATTGIDDWIDYYGQTGIVPVLLTPKYVPSSQSGWDSKVPCIFQQTTSSVRKRFVVAVPVNTYGDPTSFRSASKGQKLYYELATPIITPLEETALVYPVFRDGISSWITSPTQPTQVPVISTLETQTKAEAIRTGAISGANAFEALNKVNNLLKEYDLTTSSWPTAGNSSTYTVNGITATSHQIIMIPNDATAAQISAINNAGFQVTAQGNNQITLKVNGTSPNGTSLTLHFLIMRT